ncbi:chondroitin AC/alginate lyase [Penicillium verhagenii]|nr:chondroitin AC/alginate lyase [Penicillium verhagenii]
MVGATVISLFLCLLSLISAFSHPGLLVTNADIARARKHIKAKQDPWLASWEDLISIEYSNALYTNNAVSIVYRGADGSHAENVDLLWHDAAAAFNLGLRCKISGETEYAEAAAKILVAWGETLTEISGDNDAYLAAGLQGAEMANAAELLRDYAPFKENGFGTFTAMMEDVFLSMNLEFLNHLVWSETNVKHYFANWELANMNSAIAIGVLTDNQTAYDYVQTLAAIGQQAYNQGDDLFAYNNSRILQGAEYFARYNLGYDVPFEPYTNGVVDYTEISSYSRGANRPNWELLWNHYGVVKGLDAPWKKEYLNYSLTEFRGFEPGAGAWGEGSGYYDGLGWGSLLYHQDASDVAAAKIASSSAVASSRYTTSSSTRVASTFSTLQTSIVPTTQSSTVTTLQTSVTMT